MLIHRGNIIAGGGTIVMPMTRAEYEANKAVLDSADVWIDLTDEPDSVADGECVQYDSDLNFEDIGNIATKAIAKVEPSNTALYLHKVGDGFINKDGNYCITDVQISVGGTITLGTNCHVVDGGISSNLATHYDGNQNLRIESTGNVVVVQFNGASVTNGMTLNIPGNPYTNIWAALIDESSSRTIRGGILTNGTLALRTLEGATISSINSLSGQFTFISN